MSRSIIFFILVICFNLHGQEGIQPSFSWSFSGGSIDETNDGAILSLRNNTEIFEDPLRGPVLRFSADEKSYAVFDKTLIQGNSATISFFFYWEESGSGPWHQLFEFYDRESKSNLFFTPQDGWASKVSNLIADNKWYGIYEANSGIKLEKEEWTHIAITIDERDYAIYYNGNEAYRSSFSLPFSALEVDSLLLGGNPYRSDNFYISARLDEINFFNESLTEQQIIALADEQNIPEINDERATSWEVSSGEIELEIDLSDQRQTIQNFGSSDGWNVQRIGKYWPEEKKEELAELLFSTEKDDAGHPLGIGLSSWRFNIGAGTAEQGDASRISAERRRTESFINPDGQSYDWSKQIGQQWFLKKAAIDYNLHHIIGWQNSPPVIYTENHLGFREFGTPVSTILKEEHFDDFGIFLADVVTHFGEEGVEFDYISPLNEPQYGWSPTELGGTVSQEGTPWTNQEIYDVVTAIDKVFSERNISTKLFITEAGASTYHTGGNNHASNQLHKFWNEFSSMSLKGKPSFANIVSYHSYWNDHGAALVNDRQKLFTQAMTQDPATEIWQTEYSLLGGGYRNGYPQGYKLTETETALSLARVIMTDLNVANVTAWQWWSTFALGKHQGESRFAIIEALTKADNSDGVYFANKLFYAIGQFSHFIRPNMIRVGIKRSDQLSDLEANDDVMLSAYTSENNEHLIVVAVNVSDQAKSFNLKVKDTNQKTLLSPAQFLTDEFTSLKRVEEGISEDGFIVPARSIVTYTAELTDASSISETKKSAPFKAWYDLESQKVYFSLSEQSRSLKEVRLYGINGVAIESIPANRLGEIDFFETQNLPSGSYFICIMGDQFMESKLVEVIKN